MYCDTENLHVVGVADNSHITMVTVALETGKVKNEASVPASWISDSTV